MGGGGLPWVALDYCGQRRIGTKAGTAHILTTTTHLLAEVRGGGGANGGAGGGGVASGSFFVEEEVARNGGRRSRKRTSRDAGVGGPKKLVKGSMPNSIVCSSKQEMVFEVSLNSNLQIHLHPNNCFGIVTHFQN